MFLAAEAPADALPHLLRARDGGDERCGPWLGRAYLALGDRRAAVDAWQRALAFVPADRGAVPLRLDLARALMGLRRWDEAREVLLVAARLDPANARVRQALQRLEAPRRR